MSFSVSMDTRYLRAIPVSEPAQVPMLELGPLEVNGHPMTLQIGAVAGGSSGGGVDVVLQAVVIDGQGGRWWPIVGLKPPRY